MKPVSPLGLGAIMATDTPEQLELIGMPKTSIEDGVRSPVLSLLDDGNNSHLRPKPPLRPSAQSNEELWTSPSFNDLVDATTSPIPTGGQTISQSSSGFHSKRHLYRPLTDEVSPKHEASSGTVYRPHRRASLPTEGYLPPKAFYKTHHFFNINLGYWRQPVRHSSIFTFVFLSTFLPCYYSSYGFVTIQNSPFIPFEHDCMSSSGWSFAGTNLRFGRFSFGQAKAIDLAWNWVVGRGYQGILTLLAFRIFGDALLRCAELAALPFELYATLALPSTKFEVFWQLSKNLLRYGNWRVKTIFVWLFLSTIYLIAVPGLMDAATAYESILITRFSWPDTMTERTDSFHHFIDQSKKVTATPICLSFYCELPNPRGYYSADYKSQDDDTKRWGFEWYPLPSSESEFQNQTKKCGSPTLVNGSFYRCSQKSQVYNWTDKTLQDGWWDKFQSKYPLQAIEEELWSNWSFYPSQRTNYICETEMDVYSWGFSFEWLFIIVIVNTIFVLGNWVLWVDCDTNSELCRVRRRLGTWRAVMDLSEAVREELGPDICAYSENDLAEVLQKRPPIKYVATRGKGVAAHLGLTSSAQRDGGFEAKKRFKIEWGKEYGHER